MRAVLHRAISEGDPGRLSVRRNSGGRRLAPQAALLLIVAFLLCGAGPAAAADVEALGLQGRAALEDGLYEVAEKQFRAAVDASGGVAKADEDLVASLLRTLYGRQQYAAMLDILAAWGPRPAPRGGIPFWSAMALYESGRPAEALAAIQELEKHFPGGEYGSRVMRLRAWCRLKMGDPAAALADFAAFEKAYPDSPERAQNLLEWSRALVVADRKAEARQVIEKLLAIPGSPAAVEARYWLARLLADERQWAQAVQVLAAVATNAAVRGDLRAEAWLFTGEVQGLSTNFQEAILATSNGLALVKSPEGRRQGVYQLGRLFLDAGRWDDGVRVLKGFVQSYPADPVSGETQLRIGTVLLDQGRNEEAAAEFQHYLETFTNVLGMAQAQDGRGWALMKLGRFAESAGSFLKAYGLFTDPERKSRSLFKAGDAYFANGQYTLAAETYGRVAAEFPALSLAPTAVYQSGESLVRSGDAAVAETRLLGLMDRYPGSPLIPDARLRVASIREGQGRWTEALADYEGVLAGVSNRVIAARALNGRAMVLYSLFRFSEAREAFERVVREHPGEPPAEQAYYMRGMCDYWIGKDEQALALCREFVQTFTNSVWVPEVMFWIAKYDYNQGHDEVSEKEFVEFAEKYPKHRMVDEALLRAGHAAARRKEYVRAMELFTRLVKEYPSSRKIPDARFAQADALSELANHPAAILIYEEIILKYPDHELVPAAWGRKGDCQFTLGAENPKRYEEAIESYRVVSGSSVAKQDLVLQARYKIGRCLEKLGRIPEALEQYYLRVVVPYLQNRDKGVWHSEAAKLWFTRAAFKAADILEAKQDWSGAVNVLERVAAADVAEVGEAQERAKRIKAEHWWDLVNPGL